MIATPRTDTLAQFVADVAALRLRHDAPRPLADAVAQRLGRLLGDPDWLAEEHRQPWEDRYRQHILYVAPDGGFSVVSLVWKPGQKTPIHDHVSWCVVGVYQGEEMETRYALYREAGGQFLVPTRRERATPGETVALVPPDEDIHEVACDGDQPAISIHVYGADIGTLGTSINHRFDDLPIRSEAGDARRVSWRETRAG